MLSSGRDAFVSQIIDPQEIGAMVCAANEKFDEAQDNCRRNGTKQSWGTMETYLIDKQRAEKIMSEVQKISDAAGFTLLSVLDGTLPKAVDPISRTSAVRAVSVLQSAVIRSRIRAIGKKPTFRRQNSFRWINELMLNELKQELVDCFMWF